MGTRLGAGRVIARAAAALAILLHAGAARAQDLEPVPPPEAIEEPDDLDDLAADDLEPAGGLDEGDDVTPADVQPVAGREPRRARRPAADDDHLVTPWGMSLTVGGGLSQFADDSIDEVTDVGGAYDVRLHVGTRSPVSFEAAYFGSARDVDALGLDDGAGLVASGVEVDARLNFGNAVRLDVAGLRASPFAFGGLAYQRFDLVDEGLNTSSLADNDDTFAIPIGAGVELGYERLTFDTRFTWRETFDEDLVRTPTGSAADVSLDNWSLTARIGIEF